MYSKHDELDKEMDFQMHLHEPRRIRIETDIHNVRAGNKECFIDRGSRVESIRSRVLHGYKFLHPNPNRTRQILLKI
jgi:hypothetical protein